MGTDSRRSFLLPVNLAYIYIYICPIEEAKFQTTVVFGMKSSLILGVESPRSMPGNISHPGTLF